MEEGVPKTTETQCVEFALLICFEETEKSFDLRDMSNRIYEKYGLNFEINTATITPKHGLSFSTVCCNYNKKKIIDINTYYSKIFKTVQTTSEPEIQRIVCSGFWSCHCILGMFEETMQPLQWAQSKSVSPALLIRGPAISVWVVVLWCKDSKMSGSLVDQVNHALSPKQWSSAVAIIALTSWLTECFMANTWRCGRQWVPAMLTETLRVQAWGINVNSNFKKTMIVDLHSLQSTLHLTHKQTSMSCWSVLKKPTLERPLQ